MRRLPSITTVLAALMTIGSITAQVNTGSLTGSNDDNGRLNTITTAVPFLIIAPDTRAGAMGDAGVATSADANSIHWNPAKLAYVKQNIGFGFSYTPWLRKLVPDINLAYVSGYKRIDQYSTFAASLRYFTLGDIQFTDEYGNETLKFRPNEFALDAAYARKLSDHFSGGIAVRFVNSNLTGGTLVQGTQSKPGRAVAVDVSGYYQSDDFEIAERKSEFAAGLNISNIGNRMAYSNTTDKDFIPINLRLGPRLTVNLDDANSLTFTVDVNKLMVPTRPIYVTDDNGQPVTDPTTNELMILSGKDPNRAVANGMFGSFSDAPGIPVTDENGNYVYDDPNDLSTAQIEKGSVLREELQEIMYAFGAEYWYADQFALRAGYFFEHELKGNRKYLTVGAGLKYNVFSLDFSYLIPANFNTALSSTSPLDNTLRFSLLFDFAAFKTGGEPAEN